jgi:AcrR family transcriptional regulator
VPLPSRVTRATKDERRDKILEATWKLIARDGLGATSMRSLAAEAGYANGALAYYFEGKDELLQAAFEYVLEQTHARIAAATRDLRGLAALRAFCKEMMPDNELKTLEARVVVPFWSAAFTHAGFADLHEQALTSFRRALRKCLSQAVALGEIPAPKKPSEHAQAAESLLTMLHGMQVLGVLSPKQHNANIMWAMVEDFIAHMKS